MTKIIRGHIFQWKGVKSILFIYRLKSTGSTNQMPGKKWLYGILCLATLLLPRVLIAAEWSIQPSISFGVEYDDNATFSTGTQDPALGWTLSPQLYMKRRTSKSAIGLGARVRAIYYQNQDNRTEGIVSFDSKYQASERNTWRLKGTYTRVTEFRTIEIETDTDELEDTDNGIEERVKVRLRPSWTRQLSPRSALRLEYRFVDVSYPVGSADYDYETHLVFTRYSRKISQKDSLRLTVSAARYIAPDNNTETDNQEILAGMKHAFSETRSGTYSVGWRQTKEQTGTRSDGFVLDAGLRERSELTTLNGIIRSSVMPSSSGQVVQGDQFRFRMRRKMSQKTDFLLRARILRDRGLEGSGTGADRLFYEIRPEFRWKLAREWFLNTWYRYQWKKYDDQPETAISNTVSVGVSFVPFALKDSW